MSTAYSLTPESTSWRPRSPRVAVLALRRGVPFDFLDLNPIEQALLRTLHRKGTTEDLDVLLAHVGYSDTKYTLDEHLLAMVLAVGKLTETHGVVSRGPRRRGRPGKVEPYRPIESDWSVVLRWFLPWLFRQTLDSTDITLKPELTYDPTDPALPWHNESDERNVRQVEGRLPHAAVWPEWHSASPECREALRLKRRNGQPTNPAPTEFVRKAIKKDIAAIARASMSCHELTPHDRASALRKEAAGIRGIARARQYKEPDYYTAAMERVATLENEVATYEQGDQMNALAAREIIERLDRIEQSSYRIELRQLDEEERRRQEDESLLPDEYDKPEIA